MKKKFENPLFSWCVWSAIIALILFFVLLEIFPDTWEADKTKISIGILVVFFLGWSLSFVHAFSLRSDWKEMTDATNGAAINVSTSSYLMQLIQKAEKKLAVGGLVSADNLISAYQMHRDHKRRIVALLSVILITIGLIGTILGLIHSMAGLNEIVMSIDASRDNLISGLRQTISGMGTAFYTTLFGAIFGGVMLKTLAHQAHASMISISGIAMEYLEFRVSKETSEETSMVKAASLELENSLKVLNYYVQELNSSLTKARQEVDEFSSSMLNSRLHQISQQLEDIAQTLRNVRGNQKPHGSE